MLMRLHIPILIAAWLSLALLLRGELPDLVTVPEDLHVPAMVKEPAAAGRRVQQTTTGWEGTAVHHALYLPMDWKPGGTYPVLVEYAGNGGYKNSFGDVSHGTVEGSRLGYGLSGGRGFIWLCLPFISIKYGVKSNATTWWGDVAETKRYCIATVRTVCQQWGGNERAVILCGFSRGSIACNYIGLHDDEIAGLWRGFFCHSHYDGVNTRWPYPDADAASARVRLQRLAGRPQFISMEKSVDPIRDYLGKSGVTGDFTFVPLPFRNHSDAWVLRDIPERRAAREWLQRAVSSQHGN